MQAKQTKKKRSKKTEKALMRRASAIRAVIAHERISMTSIAEKAGYSRTHVSYALHNRNNRLSTTVLSAIEGALLDVLQTDSISVRAQISRNIAEVKP